MITLGSAVAQNVAFWILAVGMAVAAIGVVRSQNVVHSALFLVVVTTISAPPITIAAITPNAMCCATIVAARTTTSLPSSGAS